jgi:hypothetical protein
MSYQLYIGIKLWAKYFGTNDGPKEILQSWAQFEFF